MSEIFESIDFIMCMNTSDRFEIQNMCKTVFSRKGFMLKVL